MMSAHDRAICWVFSTARADVTCGQPLTPMFASAGLGLLFLGQKAVVSITMMLQLPEGELVRPRGFGQLTRPPLRVNSPDWLIC